MNEQAPEMSLDDWIDLRGMSIEQVAEAAKINAKSLLSIRNGQVVRPRVPTISRLAKVLKISPFQVRQAVATAVRKWRDGAPAE